jgi:4-amino-4-deoxy-L-arabinose transferase-like glycosyltransferase
LDLFLLTVWCGFLSFYGLGAGQLYRTESLRAVLAAEFLRSGDWIVPRLYGEPVFTKPPLMYAAIALASVPVGRVTEWTARLPSACAALATVLLVYWQLGRQIGRRGGLIAAILLPVSFLWLDKASSAEIDMLQTAWVTAAILFFLRALEEIEDHPNALAAAIHFRVSQTGEILSPYAPDSTAKKARTNATWFWWFLALLCVSGGLLTKWTAPLFFYGTAIPLLWLRGRLRLLSCRQHLAAAGVALAICLCWACQAITRAGCEVFFDSVSREALVHLSPGHHHSGYPWAQALSHPFVVWAAGLPMSVFALPALWPGFLGLWDQKGRRLLQALHCWIWPNLVFWSLLPGHNPRQAFPILPALAGLAAMVWCAWFTARMPWPLRPVAPASVLGSILVIWVIVKLGFVHVAAPARDRGRDPRGKGEQIAACVPLGETLYLFRLKDEGILFYYRRPAQRLAGPEQLPSSGQSLYCIVDASEWQSQRWPGKTQPILKLCDEQGAPILLVHSQGMPAR